MLSFVICGESGDCGSICAPLIYLTAQRGRMWTLNGTCHCYEACTVTSLKGSVSTFKRLQIHSYLFNISMHGAIMQYACMHICSSFNALRIPSMHVCLHDCFLALLPLKAILNHFCSSTGCGQPGLHSSNFHGHHFKLPILQRRNRNNSACYVRTSRSAFFIYMINVLIWN